MSELQRTASVLVHEYALDGHNIRLEFRDDAVNRLKYLPQSIGEAALHTLNRATGDIGRCIALEIEDTESGQA